MLIIDGGSVDATVSLAAQLLGERGLQHRVNVVDGSSIHGAINHGIKAAKGEWLHVMGSDDMLLGPDVSADFVPTLLQAQPGVWVVHGDVWIEDPAIVMVRNEICCVFWSARSAICRHFIVSSSFRPEESNMMKPAL